jgi:hypothetical protein
MTTEVLMMSINSVLVATVAFFLVRLIKSIDQVQVGHRELYTDFKAKMAIIEHRLDQAADAAKRVQSIEAQLGRMESDIELASRLASQWSVVREEVTIVRRDLNSVWKRIDDVQRMIVESEFKRNGT